MSSDDKTTVEKWHKWFENHPVFAPLIFLKNMFGGLPVLTGGVLTLFGLYTSMHAGANRVQEPSPSVTAEPSNRWSSDGVTEPSPNNLETIWWDSLRGKFG